MNAAALFLTSIVTLSVATNVVLMIHSYVQGGRPSRAAGFAALARVRRQIAAYLIDGCVLVILTLLLASTYGSAAALVSPIVFFIFAFLYPLVLYRFAARTWGQMAMKLRRPMARSFSETAAARAVLAFLLTVYGFPFGFLCALVDAERRTIDEKIVGLRFSTEGTGELTA
ncbi:MAG TPA: hypothetical protein VGF28_17580 [Thermoanaerobaculia bacterium]|jgi:hypothetical protein